MGLWQLYEVDVTHWEVLRKKNSLESYLVRVLLIQSYYYLIEVLVL